MVHSTTHTASWPRLAAQDRHAPKTAVPLALSIFGPRRGVWVRSAIDDHLTARAAERTI